MLVSIWDVSLHIWAACNSKTLLKWTISRDEKQTFKFSSRGDSVWLFLSRPGTAHCSIFNLKFSVPISRLRCTIEKNSSSFHWPNCREFYFILFGKIFIIFGNVQIARLFLKFEKLFFHQMKFCTYVVIFIVIVYYIY